MLTAETIDGVVNALVTPAMVLAAIERLPASACEKHDIALKPYVAARLHEHKMKKAWRGGYAGGDIYLSYMRAAADAARLRGHYHSAICNCERGGT